MRAVTNELRWTQIVAVDGILLAAAVADGALQEIRFDAKPFESYERSDRDPLLKEAAAQLRAYFEGQLREFDLPLDPKGTGFQRQVWMALRDIPYGETRSYRDIAIAVGSPKGVRAVGAANGRNPLPIVVPCHRVIGSSGKLVGFGGGLPMKERLLALESPQRGFGRNL